MNNYYTYAYLREDGTPYYIGKGKGKRIHQKCRRLFNLPPKERRIFLKKNLTEKEAFNHEIYMISVLGRKDLGTGILNNFTDGGEGASGLKCSEETRRKLSESHKGITASEETKRKMSESHKGRIPSKESRKKMSESRKGITFSEETRKKMSLSKRGKKWGYHSEEAKERIIQRHYKIWKFISPTEEIVEEYTTLSEFCRKYSLDRVKIGKLIKEKIKQYKGWRFIPNSSEG
jgi:hypothetical protein